MVESSTSLAIPALLAVAVVGWIYGLCAGIRARKYRNGGATYRWSERTVWAELAPLGRRWQLRSYAGFAVFVASVLIAGFLSSHYHRAV